MTVVPKKQLQSHSLAETIVAGNTTGGTNIVVSTGASIVGQTNLALSAPSGFDLSLAARGSTPVTLNQVDHINLGAAFTSESITSIIGALNSLQNGDVAIPGVIPLRIEQGSIDFAGQTIFEMPDNVKLGFSLILLNGVIYPDFEGWFEISGAGNKTWTWQDLGPVGELQTSWKIAFIYFEEV